MNSKARLGAAGRRGCVQLTGELSVEAEQRGTSKRKLAVLLLIAVSICTLLSQSASAKSIESSALNSTTSISSNLEDHTEIEPNSISESEEDDARGADHDADDAQDCPGLSSGGAQEGRKLTDNERLVNLQACLQKRVRRRLAGATRSGMEMFERLSLSGGCTWSLMNLMGAMGDIKSYAFKFLDASAKLPSGVMYGLLSDFGDFDQCLSIRSNQLVAPAEELEWQAYSGKYCLVSLKLTYHVQLGANSSVPAGIYPDGVLWDELVRNYWTSKSPKGFQVGVCVPSRCTSDDLEQIVRMIAADYNFEGQIMSCQDSNELARQQTPDLLQRLIVCAFVLLLALTCLGTLIERYLSADRPSTTFNKHTIQTLAHFSLARNWRKFTRYQKQPEVASHTLRHQVESIESNLTQFTLGIERQASSCSSCDSTLTSSTGAPECRQVAPVGAHNPLSHLSGMKLLIIIWITVGHSFLYPSASNYQYYRSIINMNITRDSVWFATTNFTLAIDMLLYIIGLLFVHQLVNASVRSRTFVHHHHQAKPNNILLSTTTIASTTTTSGGGGAGRVEPEVNFLEARQIGALMLMKLARFLPTYVAVIALAQVIPLLSDGPMWPEMVGRRLGASCRRNWWANLLMINNWLSEPEVCLPSSWFVSVMVQCLLVGVAILLIARRFGPNRALVLLALVLLGASVHSFVYAYENNVRAPAIRMDETFVLEIDDTIYRLYTSTANNLTPFLVGMLGGLLLPSGSTNYPTRSKRTRLALELNLLVGVALIGVLVLSSVFHESYTRLWAAVYWSCHRTGWAIVTGYIVHQCASGRWKLLKDFLSLSSLAPISRLTFTAYLVYPIFIHIHSGLVRDGLHVSIYNMMNIYITRLVMTFALALLLHLLIDLPSRSLLDQLVRRKQSSRGAEPATREPKPEAEVGRPNCQPLLGERKGVVVNE